MWCDVSPPSTRSSTPVLTVTAECFHTKRVLRRHALRIPLARVLQLQSAKCQLEASYIACHLLPIHLSNLQIVLRIVATSVGKLWVSNMSSTATRAGSRNSCIKASHSLSQLFHFVNFPTYVELARVVVWPIRSSDLYPCILIVCVVQIDSDPDLGKCRVRRGTTLYLHYKL